MTTPSGPMVIDRAKNLAAFVGAMLTILCLADCVPEKPKARGLAAIEKFHQQFNDSKFSDTFAMGYVGSWGVNVANNFVNNAVSRGRLLGDAIKARQMFRGFLD